MQSWGTDGPAPGPLMDPLARGSSGPLGPGDPVARTTALPGPGMPGAGPQDQPWPTVPPRRGRGAWVLIASVAGLALIVGILLATRHNPGNASAGPNPTASRIAGRTAGRTATSTPATKRGPITVANILPQTQLNIDGLQFTRVAAAMVKDCASAANGAFASALTSSGCKRVVRATYVDAHKQYVVTAGVAAMPTPTDASKVDAVKKFGPDVWFTALNGPANSGASAASKTVGVGNDVVDNRFIVFALSSYCSGQNPTGHSSDIQNLTGLSQSFTSQVEQQLVARVKS